MPRQTLTLELAGMTAGDYVAHLRDPDPPALGFALRSVAVHADPLGDTVEAALVWKERPPSPQAAAAAAGLPIVDEVVRVETVDHPIPNPASQPNRLAALTERLAARLAAQPRPAKRPPLVVRWA